jgi:hypothetical protein
VRAYDLNLAGVNGGPDLDSQPADVVGNGARAVDRGRRLIEGGEESVAGGIHLASTETIEISPDDCVMCFQEVPPAPVSDLGGTRGGAGDISEHDSG